PLNSPPDLATARRLPDLQDARFSALFSTNLDLDFVGPCVLAVGAACLLVGHRSVALLPIARGPLKLRIGVRPVLGHLLQLFDDFIVDRLNGARDTVARR